MFNYPNVMPIEELQECYEVACKILQYQKNNWAIGQLYPNGGPDCFTYFFSRRNIPIANYLRGNISLGEPTAYDVNLNNLCQYINWVVGKEVAACVATIADIEKYEAKNWAIGEAYPDAGPDGFVKFFADHDNLPIAPYLRGTVSIGYPTAYQINIKTLKDYIRALRSYRCIIEEMNEEKKVIRNSEAVEGFVDGQEQLVVEATNDFREEPEVEYEIEFVLEE